MLNPAAPPGSPLVGAVPFPPPPPPPPPAKPDFIPTAVEVDADFQRIAALPRFAWDQQTDLEAGRQALTNYLRWNASPCQGGTWEHNGVGYLCSVCKSPYELLPIQAAALRAIYDLHGLFGSMSVGSGKTAVTLLAPTLLGSTWPLLIVSSSLLEKTLADISAYARHWRLHHAFTSAAAMNGAEFKRSRPCLLKYAELSRDAGAMKLLRSDPDVVMLDECQIVKNRKAAVTKKISRFIPQVRKKRTVIIAALSGSVADNGFGEFWHPLKWALGVNSPLPLDLRSFLSWSYAMDENVPEMTRLAPGPLVALTPGALEIARANRAALRQGQGSGAAGSGGPTWDPALDGEPEPLEVARAAFAERFSSCAGVISSRDDIPRYGLEIHVEKIEAPASVKQAIEYLRENWETPDGNEFENAIELWVRERSMARGGWHCWDPMPPIEWRTRRKAKNAFVRDYLRDSKRLDSPDQVYQAVTTGRTSDGSAMTAAFIAAGRAVFDPWLEIKPTFEENSVWRWLPAGSHIMLERAAKWLREHDRAIVWVQTIALGEALAAMTGVPYYHEAGCDARGVHVRNAKGRAICSIASCGTGQNLQFEFTHNYCLEFPTSGRIAEQMLGRTHRNGQREDTVTVVIPLMTEGDGRGLQHAIKRARYAFTSRKEPQKLVYGTWTGEDPWDLEGLV